MYDASRLDVSVVVAKVLEHRAALIKSGVALAEVVGLTAAFQGNLTLLMMQVDEAAAWKGQSIESVRLAAAAQAIVEDWENNHLAPHPSGRPDDLEMLLYELRQGLKGTG